MNNPFLMINKTLIKKAGWQIESQSIDYLDFDYNPTFFSKDEVYHFNRQADALVSTIKQYINIINHIPELHNLISQLNSFIYKIEHYGYMFYEEKSNPKLNEKNESARHMLGRFQQIWEKQISPQILKNTRFKTIYNKWLDDFSSNMNNI